MCLAESLGHELAGFLGAMLGVAELGEQVAGEDRADAEIVSVELTRGFAVLVSRERLVRFEQGRANR